MMKLLSTLLLAVSFAATGSATAERFLQDGGGIRSQRIDRVPVRRGSGQVFRPGGERRFLQDGGSVRSEPAFRYGRSFKNRRFVDEGRSVTRLRDDFRTDQNPDFSYGTSGTGTGISVIYIGTPQAGPASSVGTSAVDATVGTRMSASPKIIDVASARLDRRSHGASGIDVVYSGTTKIIRIAPGYRRKAAMEKDEVSLPEPDGAKDFASLSPREQAVTVYTDLDAPADEPLDAAPAVNLLPSLDAVPVPVPAPRDGPQASRASPEEAAATPAAPEASPAAGGFEPWTADWLRDCVARYPDFDASLGTYLDETGRRRFCTGEP